MTHVRTLTIVGGLLMAVAATTASIAGQAQSLQPSPAQQQAGGVKATGCLKKWDATTMGGSGTGRIADPDGAEYVLTGVARPADTNLGHNDRYLIKPRDGSVTLSAHVDHQVEVSGEITNQGTGEMRVPTLTVSSVRMVSSSCVKF